MGEQERRTGGKGEEMVNGKLPWRRKRGERPAREGENETSTLAARLQAGERDDKATLLAALEDTTVAGRALLSDHPALGLGARADHRAGGATLSILGTGSASEKGTTEGLPVLLLEPHRSVHGLDPETGTVQTAQVQMICEAGFTLWDSLLALQPAPGWSLSRPQRDTLELHGPDSDLWAHAPIDLDPQWVSAAVSQHVVLVVYGPQLGVRCPENINPSQYTDSQRCEELHRARELGFVAAAIVSWST